MPKRCYNCRYGNKADKESISICKECGLPVFRKNWKPFERYIIKDKSTGKYYRSARAKHLFDNWVDDMQLATVFYTDAINNRFCSRYFNEKFEKIYIEIVR